MQANSSDLDLGDLAWLEAFKLPAQSGPIDPSLFWFFFHRKESVSFKNRMAFEVYGECGWIQLVESDSKVNYLYFSSPPSPPEVAPGVLKDVIRTNLRALKSGGITDGFAWLAMREIEHQLGFINPKQRGPLEKALHLWQERLDDIAPKGGGQ